MEGSRVTYVVVRDGETLADLSARYETSTEELLRMNAGMRDVAAGDVIKVQEQEPNFREPRQRTHFVLGFYTGPMGVNMPGSQSSFTRHADLLSAVAPYWFDLDSRTPGNIKARVSPDQIKTLVAQARQRGVKIFASIHNTDKLGPGSLSRTELMRNILRPHRMAFFRNLFSLVNEYGFDGINLDFEKLRPSDKALYTDFVRDLTERARKQGKQVVVDVLGDIRKQPYSLEFDYPGLAAASDYLAIMTYDQFKPSEATPGPVAAYNWVDAIVRAAINDGVPSRKILLGIPTYGYDWTVGQPNARALSHSAVERLRNQYKGTVAFHPTYRVPHMSYTDERGQKHEVWYENSRSTALKLDLVRKYNLGGAIIWRLGLEDPTTWGVIRAKLSPIE